MIDNGGNNPLNGNFGIFLEFCDVFLSCKILIEWKFIKKGEYAFNVYLLDLT